MPSRLLIFLLTILFSCASKKELTKTIKNDLKNAKVYETTFNVKKLGDEFIPNDSITSRMEEIDSLGNISYDKVMFFEYNSGFETHYERNSIGDLERTIVIYIDRNGRELRDVSPKITTVTKLNDSITSYESKGDDKQPEIEYKLKRTKDGVVVYQKSYSEDEIFFEYEYERNEKGDCILSKNLITGIEYKFQYKYNELGHWTHRTQYVYGKPSEIVIRRINYLEK